MSVNVRSWTPRVSLLIRFTVLVCVWRAALRVQVEATADSYYSLLGIAKDANSLEIRKAFKKLALEWHPDKNKDDPQVYEKFLKLNQAYEVLKDEESRRKYDLYGEEDGNKRRSSRHYESWNYYQENFGIYDEDPEILTLSNADFERFVSSAGTDTYWFINFYSPMCSHCHHLAPVWREIARELKGVIRFGAVNCGEDWTLCRRQGIGSYPSLMLYPHNEKYFGDRSAERLTDYVLRNIPSKLLTIRRESELQEHMKSAVSTPISWLFFFCDITSNSENSERCPSEHTQLKVSAMLSNLVHVARVGLDIARKLYDGQELVVFFPARKLAKQFAKIIPSLDAQEISRHVLDLLPDVEAMDHESLSAATDSMWTNQNSALGICFVDGSQLMNDVDLELKKLPFLLPKVNISKVDCSSYRTICNKYHVHKYPSFVILKSGGRHEFYHDRLTAMDIASFVKQSVSSFVDTLVPNAFSRLIIEGGETWFVDFYAPWCPPCLQLLPEWRKASRSFNNSVRFGTVDCTVHHTLCDKYNVRSYPTTVLFNRSIPHHYTGKKTSDEIVEFIQDRLSPSVVMLDFDTFKKLVIHRSSSDLWAIDFYAPWCGPCQQLEPQWRKMAKMFSESSTVYVGQVDCTVQEQLCNSQEIRSYPTLRVYPIRSGSSDDVHTFHEYGDWNRDADSLRTWVHRFLPGSVVELDNNDFYNRVVYGTEPWIVDFYASWCGHCHSFAPEFESIALQLNGFAKAGKVNCEKTRFVCQQAGIRAYPTVKFYPGSLDRSQQQNIQGETIDRHDRETIIAYVMSWVDQRQTEFQTAWSGHEFHDEL